MAKLEVTVATINWNGGSCVKTFFESVKSQDFPKEKMEIIMVDNGSTDGSLEFVKENFPFVKIIEKEKNYGFATACNIAFAAASANLFITTGNDTIMPENFVSSMVSEIKKTKAAVVVAKDYPIGSSLDLPRQRDTVNIICGNAVGAVSGNGHAVMPRGSFIIDKNQISGKLFDDDYFAYGEDTWLGFKLLLEGKKIYASDKCKIWHDGAKSGSRLPTLNFYTERNRLLNIFTFFKIKTIIKVFPLLAADFFLRIFLFLFSFNFMRLKSLLSASFWIILNFGKVLSKRNEMQKRRIFDDDKLINSMSCKLYGYQRRGHARFFLMLDKFTKFYCRIAMLNVYEIEKGG